MGKSSPIFFLLLAALAFCSSCKLRSTSENLSGSYPVEPGGALIMRLNQGAVDVRTADVQAASVLVSRKVTSLQGDPREELQRQKIDISQADNELRINCQRDEGGLAHVQFGDVIDTYQIEIPRRFTVDIQSGVGGIRVASIEGKVTISTAGDGIAVENIQGPATLKSSGGDIRAGEISGFFTAQASGGDVSVNSALGGMEVKSSGGDIHATYAQNHVQLKSAGGDIKVDHLQGGVEASTAGGNVNISFQESPREDCELKSAGGDVTVTLPAEVNANLDAKTSAGSVNTDFPLTVRGKIESSQLNGTLGQGGATIRLRTSGGDIQIKRKDRE